jgi:4-amino-4-deoxy-L-arabinose transferase-like glycosyltransferase
VLFLANRPYQEIVDRGAGRSVFRQDHLIFSASDNSDPTTNGYVYGFQYPRIGRGASRLLYAATGLVLLVVLITAIYFSLSRGLPALANATGLTFLSERVRSSNWRSGGRVPWRVAVYTVLLAWFTSALVDPVYVIDLTVIQFARLLTAAILVAAGYSAAAAFRSASWSWIALLRAGCLVALAAFTWLREGVTPGLPTLSYVLQRVIVFLVAGVALQIGISPSTRERLSQLLSRPERRFITTLMAVAALSVALIAASSIARHWDSSGWMDSCGYDIFAMNILTGKVPQGDSAYMPVYQYGLAFFYYVFGHFFFVQQLVNLVLAAAGIVALAWASWVLFERVAALVVVTIIAAFCRPFYYAVFFTQIESWYVPFICFLMVAWARYWRAPTWTNLAWLAGAIALGMNTRNQGAIFFAFMCTAPLWVRGLVWRQRWVQSVSIAALVALSLMPWTIRNYLVEGRLSPSGSRSALYIGVQNDRRIGLYGIRYWEGWAEVQAEFAARYPDPAERERAYIRAGWTNVVSDPVWLGRALLWRSAAFYGVLPDAVFNWSRMVQTDWKNEWRGYVFSRTTPLLLLSLSLLAVLLRPDRTSAFLTGAILANLAIVVFSASSEDRISYPSLPMHIMLAAGVFAQRGELVAVTKASRVRRRAWLACGVSLALFLVVCRLTLGSRYTYRALMERGVAIVSSVDIDQSLPLLNDYGQSVTVAHPNLHVGQRVRVRVLVSNYMVPPKYAGAVPWLPRFVTEPWRETYFYGYFLGPGVPRATTNWVGITFLGAQLSEPVWEGDAVELEGVLVSVPTAETLGYFVRAETVRRLPIDSSVLPAFP